MDAGGAHLSQNLVKPLQGAVQVQLNPAGGAGHRLPPGRDTRRAQTACEYTSEVLPAGQILKPTQTRGGELRPNVLFEALCIMPRHEDAGGQFVILQKN